MNTKLSILLSILIATASQGGWLTGAAKVAGKIAGHGADNAAERVVAHYGDDVAKSAAKGGGKATLHAVPKVAEAVDATVRAAGIEARAAKPAVEAIRRAPIVKPAHLAAGGAGAAAVVAAHNLTAGEREKDSALSEATRKTIEEHPEMLPEVVRAAGSTGFMNQVGKGVGNGISLSSAVFGGVFGLAAFVRLFSAGKRRKPAVIDVTPESDSGNVAVAVMLSLAFLAVAILSFSASRRIKNDLPHRQAPPAEEAGQQVPVRPVAARPETPPPDYSAEIRRYNDEVSSALGRHLSRLEKIAGEFETGLRNNGPRRFDGARAAIPRIRDSFSSFGAMKGVVVDGALDKAFGGDRLGSRFNAALDGPFVRPCAGAGQSLVADYETFAARMAAEDAAFREEIAAAHGNLPKAVRVEFPVERLRSDMAKTYAALDRMPRKAGLVAAETAFEIATIRSTVAAAKSLALRFGGKAIAKAAASAVAPAADGPFPFGDLIAVGGAAWTACDIYDLTHVLPREIEKSLNGTVHSLQTQTINAMSDAARQTRAAHEQAARALAAAARQ